MNPVLALIIANIIWGAGAPIFKLVLTNIPPFTLTFLRFFGAAVVFLPFLLYAKKWQRIAAKDYFTLFVGAFLGISFHIPTYFFGLQKTFSINAPVIGSAAPVFLYFLSIILLKEKFKPKVFIGMMISLLGVLAITLSPILIERKAIALGEIEGNLFLIISTLALVGYVLVFKKLERTVNFYMATFWFFLFGSLPLLPFVLNELTTWSPTQINPVGIFGILFGILFSSSLSYFLFHYGLSKITAEETGIFTYVDPIAAILIAAPLLGEYPTWSFFLGSLFVFGGIFIAEGRLHWHPFHKLKTHSLHVK